MPLQQRPVMQSYPPQYPPQYPPPFQSQPTGFNLQQSQQNQTFYSKEINDKPPNYDGFINQATTIRIEGNDGGNTMPVIPASTVSADTK